MTTIDELRARSINRGRDGRCVVGQFIDRVSARQRPTVTEALADRERINNRVVYEWMRDELGFASSYTTVAQHRAGRCSCPRQTSPS